MQSRVVLVWVFGFGERDAGGEERSEVEDILKGRVLQIDLWEKLLRFRYSDVIFPKIERFICIHAADLDQHIECGLKKSLFFCFHGQQATPHYTWYYVQRY